jgi:hypothetical protein
MKFVINLNDQIQISHDIDSTSIFHQPKITETLFCTFQDQIRSERVSIPEHRS